MVFRPLTDERRSDGLVSRGVPVAAHPSAAPRECETYEVLVEGFMSSEDGKLARVAMFLFTARLVGFLDKGSNFLSLWILRR